MLDPLLQFSEEQLAFLAAVFGMILTGVTLIACVAVVQWRKFRQRELELAFKDDMLQRGLSVAEVDLLWTGSKPGLVMQCERLWQRVIRCSTEFLARCAVFVKEFVQTFCRFVTAFFVGCTKLIKGIIHTIFRGNARRTEQELAFKRELLDRGLSVDEIKRLLTAGRPRLLTWLVKSMQVLLSVAVWLSRTIWAGLVSVYRQLDAYRRRRDEWNWDQA